jgi:hypothetical protein
MTWMNCRRCTLSLLADLFLVLPLLLSYSFYAWCQLFSTRRKYLLCLHLLQPAEAPAHYWSNDEPKLEGWRIGRNQQMSMSTERLDLEQH